MPPRFAYWTIIIDDAPTAFRARDRAELMGVLRQLANRNPNAVMKWFAHGKLWDSPEQERAAAREAARAQREPRGPDWRPGGKHADPRARFDKRGPKRRREDGTRREEAGGAGGERLTQGHEGKQPRPPAQEYPHRKARPALPRPDAKPGGREQRRWERGRDRHDRKGSGRARPTGPRFPRASGEAKTAASETPGEPGPPAPPPPPGPDRPPKPGQEPAREVPAGETIKILPDPPERAAGPKQR